MRLAASGQSPAFYLISLDRRRCDAQESLNGSQPQIESLDSRELRHTLPRLERFGSKYCEFLDEVHVSRALGALILPNFMRTWTTHMKTIIAVILCLSLIGCAGAPTQRISDDTMSSLEGKSVTVVQRESPSFVAMTSGKGMFAVAGVGAAAVAGNRLVEEALHWPI